MRVMVPKGSIQRKHTFVEQNHVFFKPKFGRCLGSRFFLVGFIPKSILGGARCCQASTHSSHTNLNPN